MPCVTPSLFSVTNREVIGSHDVNSPFSKRQATVHTVVNRHEITMSSCEPKFCYHDEKLHFKIGWA